MLQRAHSVLLLASRCLLGSQYAARSLHRLAANCTMQQAKSWLDGNTMKAGAQLPMLPCQAVDGQLGVCGELGQDIQRALATTRAFNNEGATNTLALIGHLMNQHLGMDPATVQRWAPSHKKRIVKSTVHGIELAMVRHKERFPEEALKAWFEKCPLLLLYMPGTLQTKLDTLGRELSLDALSCLKLSQQFPEILGLAVDTLMMNIQTIDALHEQGRGLTIDIVVKNPNILCRNSNLIAARFQAVVTYFGINKEHLAGKGNLVALMMKVRAEQGLKEMVAARATAMNKDIEYVKQMAKCKLFLLSSTAQTLTDKHTFVVYITQLYPHWAMQFQTYSPSSLADIYCSSWFALLRLKYLADAGLAAKLSLLAACGQSRMVVPLRDNFDVKYHTWLAKVLPSLSISQKYKDEVLKTLHKRTQQSQ